MEIDEAARVFTDPKAYADEKRFHAACALLRRESPVPRIEVEGFDSVLGRDQARRRHGDRAPARPLDQCAAPGARPEAADATAAADCRSERSSKWTRRITSVYRRISSDWFKPKGIARLNDRAAELAKRYVDRMAELGGACDFVTDVAVHYPLYVILSLLGLPEADFPRMLKLTQELFGTVDPELGRGTGQDDLLATLLDFFEYFQKLTEDRRANPTDDLASVIANAEIDGQPIGILEAVGYYVLIATAGHDTTSAAIAGGLHALIDHPDQFRRLRDDRSLVATAVDEMIRWVSPVKQFMRTATDAYVLRDVPIAAGDSVLLSYPSANRDEEVFERPEVFDVGRDPNPHLGFGFGAHFCLGTHLARMEARALYDELLPRLQRVDLDGQPAYMETLFVGGPKHLPIRYQLT